MPEKSPLVSVIVVTYNHAQYIEQCLDSILAQKTNFPFELIIGEDESGDGTRDICITYAKKYPEKIKLFLRSREDVISINGRPTGRYNFLECSKSAKGKYIALCDGDDYWVDMYKLQKQYDFLEQNEDYALCSSRVIVLDVNDKDRKHHIPISKEFYTAEDLLLHGNFIRTVSSFFRSQYINFEDPLLYKLPFADLYLWLMLSSKSKIKIMDTFTACHRMHTGGIWTGMDAISRNNNEILFLELIQEVLSVNNQQLCKKRIRKLKFTNFKHNLRSVFKQ